MPKGRRAVRLFFNTYYDDAAQILVEILESRGYKFKVIKSRVVPELYYIDITVENGKPEEIAESVKEILKNIQDDRIYGIKVYAVDANR